MAASNSPTRPGAIIEGINVTPLVDIMLVLLVIFIVTAKILVLPAVPLDLPQAAKSDEIAVVFSVIIPATGPTRVNGEPVADDRGLLAKARAVFGPNATFNDLGAPRVVIQADATVPHGRVIGTLDLLRQAGFDKVAFATKPAAPQPTP